VQAGIELADQAGDAFEGIVNDVESVANQVDSIAAATEEQSTTSEQISQNVENISTVSTEAAKGINEVAQSATQLDALTEDLAELLDQFDLGQEGHDRNAAHSEAELSAEIESHSEADRGSEDQDQVRA